LATTEGPKRKRSQFEVRDHASAGRHTFELCGELDMSATEDLQTAVRERCEQAAKTVVLDLRELAFIDSTGLRALVQVYDDCRERGHQVVLIPGRAAVQRVFDLTGLTDVLPFEDPPKR
jgi:anti-anti-sigma factor